MRLRDGLSISEIARRTSLSRNTIKTWLRTPVRSEMKYQGLAGPKKIGPYEAGLREALAADAVGLAASAVRRRSSTRNCSNKDFRAVMLA